MDKKLLRILVIELVGVFGLVLFSSGLVCINQMTSPLPAHQPGLVGIALGQGLIFAALLALTAPITGGYLNPAITLMLWVFNRIETPRAAWLIVAQFVGSILAAGCLYLIFDAALLRSADFGASHVNKLAYPTDAKDQDDVNQKEAKIKGKAPEVSHQSRQFTGAGVELLLTFFLVFAIFGMTSGNDSLKLGIVAGMIVTACGLFSYPLTGAALNPARWLGPTLLEACHTTRSAWSDSLVYLAGPILGSLLGGVFVFKVYAPAPASSKPEDAIAPGAFSEKPQPKKK
jgi:aquaporin TIP